LAGLPPTLAKTAKVGKPRRCRPRKGPFGFYSSLLAGLPPTFAKTAKVGQAPYDRGGWFPGSARSRARRKLDRNRSTPDNFATLR